MLLTFGTQRSPAQVSVSELQVELARQAPPRAPAACCAFGSVVVHTLFVHVEFATDVVQSAVVVHAPPSGTAVAECGSSDAAQSPMAQRAMRVESSGTRTGENAEMFS